MTRRRVLLETAAVLLMGLLGTAALDAQTPTDGGRGTTPLSPVVIVGARVMVESSASLDATGLDFGALVPGAERVVPPAATAGAAASGTPGLIAVDFNGARMTVSIPPAITLVGPGGRMVAALSCAHADVANALSPTRFDCAQGCAFTRTTDAHGRRFVFVGGTLPSAETARKTAGQYTGSVTVTATYTTT